MIFFCIRFYINRYFRQYLFGKNILGFEPISVSKTKYYTGIFNEELIAGGFILMFSVLGIFSIPFLLKKFKKISLYIFSFL